MASNTLPAVVFVLLYKIAVAFTAHLQTPIQDGIVLRVVSGNIDEGGTAELQCMMRTNSKVPVKVIKWLFGHQILPMGMSTTGRIMTSPPGTNHKLLIKRALSSDSGDYSCVVDINGTKITASTKLTVHCPIRTKNMVVAKAVLGESATITCSGTCYDHIYWKRNGTFIYKGGKYTISKQNGSVLHIRNVSMTDNGTYFCDFISGSRKWGHATQQVELLVLIPTNRVTIATFGFTKHQVGHYIEISCQADGIPRPESVIWFNNSHVINPSTTVATTYNASSGIAILKLASLTRFDSTVIRCVCRQKLPQRYHTVGNQTQLTVTGKPDAPIDVLLRISWKTDSIKVQLKWKPPLYHGGRRILAYRILYWDRHVCGLNWQDCDSVNEHFVLAARQAYLFYMKLPRPEMCFAVQSVNSEGLSAASTNECTFDMEEDKEPTPTNLDSVTPPSDITSGFLSTPPTHSSVSQDFQFIFRKFELCSQSLTVDKVIVRSVIVRYFTLFGGIAVAFNDVRNESLAVLGGLVYYQGTLVHPQADDILATISDYVENGNGKHNVMVLDKYLEILSSCPVVMNGRNESCTFDAYDAAALRCNILEDEPQSICLESMISSQQTLYLSIACGVIIVLLITLLAFLCCRIRLLQVKLSRLECHEQCLLEDTKYKLTNQSGIPKRRDLKSLDTVPSKRQDSLDSAIGEERRGSSSPSSRLPSTSSDSAGANDVFPDVDDRMDTATQEEHIC